MKINESLDNAKFDIIIYGASSFTGKLVLEYFFKKYSNSPQLKWGIAGRNHKKLSRALTEIKEAYPTQNNIDIPIIVADGYDPLSLDELTKQSKVILTTVGPYAKYGSLLVASCVENGTDYCDLAGETQWIRNCQDVSIWCLAYARQS